MEPIKYVVTCDMISRFLKNSLKIGTCSAVPRCYSSGGKAVKCHGFTYYKRFAKDEDPQLEISKLFMVKRVKPFKGIPYWEKEILHQMGLSGRKANAIAIVKNIPEVNACLWKVKHLIQITPITFPYGEPTHEDIGLTYLRENGELLKIQMLEVDKDRLKASETFAEDVKRMDGKTLRKQLRYQWLNPRINAIN